MLAFDHRELVHRQPIICVNVVEINQPHVVTRDAAIAPWILHRHTVAQHFVKGTVGLRE